MGNCNICNEAITNPVCSECLQLEIAQWLSDFQAGEPEEVKAVTQLFEHFSTGVNCIVCKKELNVCAHCYCEEAKNFVPKNHSEQFKRTFDFELNNSR
ncbi:hypothetical protein HZA97_09925 [Candidatus Woesearchaeota archaeon]|nr:hypothetical protein [Candidatus Woesearchaeota archaeon]